MGIPMILEMFDSHGQPLDRHPVGSFVEYLTKLPTGCRSTRLRVDLNLLKKEATSS